MNDRGTAAGHQASDALRFADVIISPYTDLLDRANGGSDHRGGPAWPEWPLQTGARHCRAGVPIDELPVTMEPRQTHRGRLTWGGPIDRHFGHQVVDFSMRIIPSLAAHPDGLIAFASHPRWGWSSMAETPVFARQILDWLGLSEEQCVLVTSPTRIEQLDVMPQAEQHYGPGPSALHLDRMDALTDRRLPARGSRSGVLYVSRASMHARIAGEEYVEEALRAAGARIMRPEEHPLAQQLRAYVSSDVVVFAEGSAVEACRLLGRDLGDVMVLQRRGQERIAEDGLRPRARSLEYRSALVGVVCGLDGEGHPFEVLGLPIVDGDRLVEVLADVLPRVEARWDQASFAGARDSDVRAWLERSLASPRVRGRASWQHMLTTLERTGLGHLVDGARERMRIVEMPPPPTPDEGASRPMRRGDPVADVLDGIAVAIAAQRYLEIGVGSGATLGHIDVAERIGVDPFPQAGHLADAPGVTIVASTSAEFFGGLAPGIAYDLVYVDGSRLFEHAYADLRGALAHTQPRSVIVLASTMPPGDGSTVRDRGTLLRGRAPRGDAGPRWHGDAYKVLLAIHDLHPELRCAVTGPDDEPLALVWRGPAQVRAPWYDSLDAIMAADDGAARAHLASLPRAPLAETIARIAAELRVGPA